MNSLDQQINAFWAEMHQLQPLKEQTEAELHDCIGQLAPNNALEASAFGADTSGLAAFVKSELSHLALLNSKVGILKALLGECFDGSLGQLR